MEKESDIYESIILIDTPQYHFCHSYRKVKKTIFIANMTFTCFIWVKGISNRKKKQMVASLSMIGKAKLSHSFFFKRKSSS